MSTIPVFVTLGDDEPVIIHIASDAFVGDLVDAAIAKLKLDVAPGKVRFRLAPSGAGELGMALDPRNTLSEAGVGERGDLVIEVIAPPPGGAWV